MIGVLLGVINLTGLAQKFTTIFLTLSGGSVLLAIVLIALASLILGMGMPVTASYLGFVAGSVAALLLGALVAATLGPWSLSSPGSEAVGVA